MRALWLENQALSFRDDIPIPEPNPGEALIKVIMAGICATDLELLRGYYPFTGIPGHEFLGRVVSSPSRRAWEACRVVGEINIPCGECATCQRGLNLHCKRRKVLGIYDKHGAFGEYLTLPLDNLHQVPDSVTDDAAVFTEPLAAALEILEQVQINPTDKVLVIGAGRLGQIIARVLTLVPCDLVVVARYQNQKTLLENLQIQVLMDDSSVPQDIDLVVEATGSPTGLDFARRAVRPRGTIILKSTYAEPVEVNLSSLVVDEITLLGSRCGPFRPALKLLENHQVDPKPLITDRYKLVDSLQAFKHASKPGVFKVLLEMDD
jgi:threonine dehydrogenase-like Zn-dependent dehydrogenase